MSTLYPASIALERRPKVGTLTVPWTVDEAEHPLRFAVQRQDRVLQCVAEGRCAICGARIRRGPIAFIGPDDGRECFGDPWMHPRCAMVALQECPFLSCRRGWREGWAQSDLHLAVYQHNMVLYLADSWRGYVDPVGAIHFEATSGLRKA